MILGSFRGELWICLPEMGVRTGIRKSRVTDVCVLTIEQTMDMINEEAVFDTPPLLFVTVVSADSVRRDYRHKRSEYATLGIPEYYLGVQTLVWTAQTKVWTPHWFAGLLRTVATNP